MDMDLLRLELFRCGKTQNCAEYAIPCGACDGTSGDCADFKRSTATDGAEIKVRKKYSM